MANLSINRVQMLQSILKPLTAEMDLTHEQFASLTAPRIPRSTIARIIEQQVSMQISRLKALRPLCREQLACELFELLAFLRGSVSPDLFPLHQRSLAQHVVDDSEGIQRSITWIDKALRTSARILINCEGLPTFLCEETQAAKLVQEKARLFGLDPERHCGPKLDLATHLHRIWLNDDLGAVKVFEMVLRLSIFMRMRRRMAPFEDFDLNDTNTVIDQLLHQCIHSGRHQLRFLDDLEDGTDHRQMKLLESTGIVANFRSFLFHRRLPGTFQRRYLFQINHPCVQNSITQAERMAASLQRRVSEHDRKMTNIAILELFRYPKRPPLVGEPEIIWRIRRLLRDSRAR